MWKVLYFGSYLKFFDVIFLPIGNVHKNIDHGLSKISENRSSADAICVTDLLSKLPTTNGEQPGVLHLKSAANWSRLYKQNLVLQNVPTFSHFHHFSLSSMSRDESKNEGVTVSC